MKQAKKVLLGLVMAGCFFSVGYAQSGGSCAVLTNQPNYKYTDKNYQVNLVIPKIDLITGKLTGSFAVKSLNTDPTFKDHCAFTGAIGFFNSKSTCSNSNQQITLYVSALTQIQCPSYPIKRNTSLTYTNNGNINSDGSMTFTTTAQLPQALQQIKVAPY